MWLERVMHTTVSPAATASWNRSWNTMGGIWLVRGSSSLSIRRSKNSVRLMSTPSANSSSPKVMVMGMMVMPWAQA